MAALPRPSRRSASQRSAGVDLSATGVERKPSTHISRLGKRTRESVLLTGDKGTLRKEKTGVLDLPRHLIAQTHHADCLTTPADPSLLTGVAHQNFSSRIAKSESTRQDVDNLGTTATGDRITPNGADNRLGPSIVARKVDKRSLRSQDGGSRSKSELALYFPNYDQLVSIEPKTPELLTIDTLVMITDEPVKHTALQAKPSTLLIQVANNENPTANQVSTDPIKLFQTSKRFDNESMKLNEAQRIEFSSVHGLAKLPGEDLMADAVYLKAHRRAERQEKQLRNIEKERAQHEKVQLERLVDGLKGHDWLRVMGISGITDTEKKLYEPKKEYLIQEVESLLEKFRVWKEEEKRRKLEKEQKAEEGDEDESESSHAEPPDYSDVDAWAARQLHREASSANGVRSWKNKRHRPQPVDEVPWPVEKPFTSFFSKPYMRAAALGKHRRGRTTVAFGHPLPDIPEQEFEMPSDLLTQDALNASARRSRRANRESKENREKPG